MRTAFDSPSDRARLPQRGPPIGAASEHHLFQAHATTGFREGSVYSGETPTCVHMTNRLFEPVLTSL